MAAFRASGVSLKSVTVNGTKIKDCCGAECCA